jgi:hypothetical protein
MTQRGEQLADQIHADLACPQCQYSLRGLPGNEIVCPECGQPINIAAYVASRWTQAWYHAPLYNMLALPLTWAFFTLFGGLVWLTFLRETHQSLWIVSGAYAFIALGGWIWTLVYVRRRFGSDEGLLLALLIHLVLPMYILGLIGFVGMAVKTAFDLSQYWFMGLLDLFWVAASVGVIVLGRVVERFVAKRCIQRYLRLRVAASSAASQPTHGNSTPPGLLDDNR